MNNKTYFNLFTGATTCTTNLMEREPSHEYPQTSWLVDFESNIKGFGPGVNKFGSTGSIVMVGRVVTVKLGIGVLVTRGVPVGGVLVGPWVLMANRSGVLVLSSGINVTVGIGEFAGGGVGV